MREYLLALLWEAGNRERRRVPEVAEYVQLRRHIGGVHPCLTLTDLASTRPSGPAQRADPGLVALDLLAVDLVCWCNDLFSYGKESQADPDAHNLVTVLAQDSDADEAAALRSGGRPVQPGAGRRTWTRRRRCAPPATTGSATPWPPAATGSGPPTTGRWGLPGTPDRPYRSVGSGRPDDHRGLADAR